MKNLSLKGFFEVKGNELYYYSAKSQKDSIPHLLKVSGHWKLDKNHNLQFIVDESQNRIFGKTVQLTTKIERVSSTLLELSLLDRLTPTYKRVKRMRLHGYWKNRFSKFVFVVKRESAEDELEFSGSWDITERNQIIYIYKRTFGKREIINSFILQGTWNIKNNTLLFSVENSKTSQLAYALTAEKNFVNPNLGKISMSVKIARKQSKRKSSKVISLWGSWDIVKRGIAFTLEGKNNMRWEFAISKRFSRQREIVCTLLGEHNKPQGFEISFLSKASSGAQLFLKGRYSKEKALQAGLFLPF